MWRLHDEADGFNKTENLERVKKALLDCADCVPGIIEFKVIIADKSSSVLESTMDIMLDSTFSDQTALDSYQVAPIHATAKELIGKVRSARECFDFIM